MEYGPVGRKLSALKFWMSVLTDIRNRGVNDVFCVVCDGLKGHPEVGIMHLVRKTFRLGSVTHEHA